MQLCESSEVNSLLFILVMYVAALDNTSVEDFRQCFQHWERRWDCCIQSQGEYFEGD